MSVRSYEHAANGCCPRSTTTTVREILGSGVLNTARQLHADIEFGAAGEQLPARALRAPHGRYRWSFTATHGEPKPLLEGLHPARVELFLSSGCTACSIGAQSGEIGDEPEEARGVAGSPGVLSRTRAPLNSEHSQISAAGSFAGVSIAQHSGESEDDAALPRTGV